VKVENILSSSSFHVEEQLEAGLMNSRFPGQFSGCEKQVGDDGPIFFRQIVDAADVFSRHDEKMDRRLGPDILESDYPISFEDEIGLFLSPDDPAK